MKGIYPDVIMAEVEKPDGMVLGFYGFVKLPNGLYTEVRTRKFFKTMFYEKYPTREQVIERFHHIVALLTKNVFKGKTLEEVEDILNKRIPFKGEII